MNTEHVINKQPWTGDLSYKPADLPVLLIVPSRERCKLDPFSWAPDLFLFFLALI